MTTCKRETFNGETVEVVVPTSWERMDAHDRRLAMTGIDSDDDSYHPDLILRNFGTAGAPIFSSDFARRQDYESFNTAWQQAKKAICVEGQMNTEIMKVDLPGMLRELDVRGIESFAVKFFLYGSPDGEEPTVDEVRAKLLRLIADGHTILPYTSELLRIND